jgi:hypothetical protein
MPMQREEHETLLNELLLPDLEHTRRTEILQALRVDYGTVLTDFDSITTNNTKLKKDNDDLIVSNSKLFRQIGVTGNETLEKETKEKEFSETITLESLERR